MADDDESPGVRREEASQPHDGVGIEMVCGLVQQEDVVAAEENARQLHPPTLAARERADGLAEHALG